MYSKAAKALDRAVKLDTKLSEAHEELGTIYYRNLKNRNKALYHYEKVLALKPNHPERDKIQDIINLLESQ